jgi:hypothetical protein
LSVCLQCWSQAERASVGEFFRKNGHHGREPGFTHGFGTFSSLIKYKKILSGCHKSVPIGNRQIFVGAGHARDQWDFSRAWPAPTAIHSERYFDNQYKKVKERNARLKEWVSYSKQ